MTPEEQSYVDNVCDAMDEKTAKVYRQYVQFRVNARSKCRKAGRKLKLWLIWLAVEVCTIPLWGHVIAQLWNWFVSLAGFNTLTWMQGYCLVFALRAIFTNCGLSGSNNAHYTEIQNIINGKESQFDSLNMSDEMTVAVVTAVYNIFPPLIMLFGGWVLSCFLYA